MGNKFTTQKAQSRVALLFLLPLIATFFISFIPSGTAQACTKAEAAQVCAGVVARDGQKSCSPSYVKNHSACSATPVSGSNWTVKYGGSPYCPVSGTNCTFTLSPVTGLITCTVGGCFPQTQQANIGSSDNLPDGAFCINKTSHPIYPATGDKEKVQRDFSIGSGDTALIMKRTYHSLSNHAGLLGNNWTWSYGWVLVETPPIQVTIRRPDGKLMTFNDDTQTGVYQRQLDRSDETVVKTPTGWRYTAHDRSSVDFDAAGKLLSLNTEDGRSTTVQYDATGALQSVADPYGRTLTFTLDASGRIATVTDPLNRVWSYAYDGSGNLVSVTNPDGTARTYHYENVTYPNYLTGITNEAGQRMETYAYDAQGRAVLSSNPLSGRKDSVVYNADGTVSVTDAEGNVRTYTIGTVNGLSLVTGVSDCQCNSGNNFTFDASGYVSGSIDKNGVVTSYTYDANGNMLTKTEAAGTAEARTTQWSYDAAGHVLSETDAMGNVTRYTYDAKGRKLTATDPLGSVTRWSWNPDGTLASSTDPNGGVTSYAYDAFGQLINVTNPDATSRSMAYDAVGRLTTSTDEAGAVTTYAYDTRDRLVRVTDPAGATSTLGYDLLGNLVSATTPNPDALPGTTSVPNATNTFTYDADGRVTSVTGPTGSVATFVYDTKGNLLKSTDFNGNVTTTTYDTRNKPLTITNAVNQVTTLSYTAVGDVASVTDAVGGITTMSYDALRRVTSITEPGNITSGFAYDKLGRVTQVTDALGNVTNYTYWGNTENIATVTTPNGGTTTYTYDAGHRVTSVTDALGNATTYAYDKRGRVAAVTAHDGAITKYSYDATGNLITETDPLGNVTTRSYDKNGNIVSVTDALSRTTKYAYTLANLHKETTDAVGGIASVSFDAEGRLTSLVNPTQGTTSFTYDKNGNLTSEAVTGDGPVTYAYNALDLVSSITNGRGQTVTFTYDAAQRLQHTDLPTYRITHTYDTAGNPTTTVGENGATITRTFDKLGRLTSRTDRFGKTISYTYDAAGNIATLTYPDGKVVTYGYDLNNRMTSVTDWANRVTSYTYDKAGRLATESLPDGTTVAHSYDIAGRETSTLHAKGMAQLFRFDYTYDVVNRIIREVSTGTLDPRHKAVNNAMTVDTSGKLQAVNNDTPTYDADGNMVSRVVGGVATAITYNELNKLTSYGSDTYTYDSEGNLIEQTVAGVSKRFAVNVNVELSEVLVEYDNAGNIVANYVYGLGLLSREDVNGGYSVYHFDSRGSTVALTDATGTITDQYAYDPYGKTLNKEGTTPNPFTYVGRYGIVDQGNDIYYMRNRFYDAELKRFLNKDSVIGKLTRPSSLNRHGYVEGNPVSYIDPKGLFVDTALDIAFIANDIHNLATDPCNKVDNVIALGLDVIGAIVPFASGLGVAYKISKSSSKSTEVVQRAMSEAELNSIRETSKLSRGGRKGPFHVSDSVNSNSKRARQRLALDSSPEVRVTLEVPKGVFSKPSIVKPLNNMPGGGTERIAPGEVDIPVKIIDVLRY